MLANLFMFPDIYSIYKITNTINGKCYIGFTSNIKQRFSAHRSRYKKYRDHPKLYAAFEKYGIENFQFEIIFQSSDYDYTLNIKEAELICLYDSVKNGYNISAGGDGCLLTEDEKLHRKKLMRQYTPPMLNKNHSAESKNKISLASQQMWSDHPEYREAMSQKHHGKIISQDTRNKMSAAKRSPDFPKLQDKNIMISLYCTDKLNIKQIAKLFRISHEAVSMALKKHGIPINLKHRKKKLTI